MNLNMNLNMNLSPKSLKAPAISYAMLRRYLPFVASLVLVVVFTYTALLVRSAVTVSASTADAPGHKVVRFDPNTISLVESLLVVSGQADLSHLGKTDPFN